MNEADKFLVTDPDVNRLPTGLLDRIRAVLHDHFVGMYLYGFLATGDYQPGRSDIDFLVITEESLPQVIVDGLEAMHVQFARCGPALAGKLEGVYVPRTVIRCHVADCPPVPTINEGSFYLAPPGRDWVIQRHVLLERQSTLAGPPPAELIDPVPRSEIRSAILDVLRDWWEPMLADPSTLEKHGYQPFAVLSMCRALYTLRTGFTVSKTVAGTWALGFLPDEWSSLIRHALAWYDGEEIAGIEETVRFMTYTIIPENLRIIRIFSGIIV